MDKAPFELSLYGQDTVECAYWGQEDKEKRQDWEASTPQVLRRARQPAAPARTAAPAKHPAKSEKVSRAKDVTPVLTGGSGPSPVIVQ